LASIRDSGQRYVLSIDQGTTGTRCAIIDRSGKIVSFAYLPHDQFYPHPGWVEQDPEQIWNNIRAVIRMALYEGKIDTSRLIAIGITNQRETTVIWNRSTGRPIYNAIVWQDVRTQPYLKKFEEHADFLYRRTGLPLSTYFSATKIKWVLENVPGAKESAKKGELLFGNMDSWLIWKLTTQRDGGCGVHATDHTNASRSLLMDIEKLRWSDEILELFQIPESMMPEIYPSSFPNGFGLTDPKSDFGRSIAITGDLGDQQASLFGQLCFQTGDTKCTHGSGSFILQNTGRRPIFSRNGLVTTVAFSMNKNDVWFAIEGSIAVSGSIITWLQKNLGLLKDPKESGKMAASVSWSGSIGVYFVPAFAGLFAPYWDPTARGLVIGLTHHTTSAHLIRAALESICFQTVDIVRAMQKDTGVTIKSLKMDGGLSANDYLMQLQADILGLNIIRSRETEMTAIGAAYVAGLASGFWKGTNELTVHASEKSSEFKPSVGHVERESMYNGWLRAVQRAMNWNQQFRDDTEE
jgi:glycerol kinase